MIKRYAVHIDQPSLRGFKDCKIVVARNADEAARTVAHETGARVIRVLPMPVSKKSQ